MSAADNAPPARTDIAVAVVEEEGRFLIGLRREGTPLSGLWEFPGGKVRAGETPADAAVRECLEETGLLVRVTGTYPPVAHDYEHAAVRLHWFACRKVEQQRPIPERFRWVTAAELPRYAFPAANASLLERLTLDRRRRAERSS